MVLTIQGQGERNAIIAKAALSCQINLMIRLIYFLTFVDYLPYKYFLLRNHIPHYGHKVLK